MKKEESKKISDYKKLNDKEAKKFLEITQRQYIEECKGYESFFDFLKKRYECDPIYWVRTARKLGFDIIKKKNKFYLKIELTNDEQGT